MVEWLTGSISYNVDWSIRDMVNHWMGIGHWFGPSLAIYDVLCGINWFKVTTSSIG